MVLGVIWILNSNPGVKAMEEKLITINKITTNKIKTLSNGRVNNFWTYQNDLYSSVPYVPV